MWMANTRPGQRRAQASNNAVESAPPLNATARGKAGANACRATSMDWVMAPGFLAPQAQHSDRQPLESTWGDKGLDRGNSSWAPIITGPRSPAARCIGGAATPGPSRLNHPAGTAVAQRGRSRWWTDGRSPPPPTAAPTDPSDSAPLQRSLPPAPRSAGSFGRVGPRPAPPR